MRLFLYSALILLSLLFFTPSARAVDFILMDYLNKPENSEGFLDHESQILKIALGLQDAARHKRRVIKLENDNLSEAMRNIPEKYWHSFD